MGVGFLCHEFPGNGKKRRDMTGAESGKGKGKRRGKSGRGEGMGGGMIEVSCIFLSESRRVWKL